jgi:DNA polymerase-4
MSRTILHVDMDAFYAAVEQRDRPEYKGKPVIVGSDPKEGKGRGIVSTCSYEARIFGVHSAQPISRAWKLCPHGIYLLPDMRKYERVSDRIMDILSGFTDMLEQVSIDEAFLDVSGSEKLFGPGPEIARKVKLRIKQELHLTASVGVAANKFIAKVASDLKKPDGLVVVKPGREKEFLAPLPVGRLWGVGEKTGEHLKKIGLERIGQIAEMPQSVLISYMGKNGAHLWQLARGIDDRPVLPGEGSKSISHEITFENNTSDAALLHRTILALTEKVAYRLRSSRVRARTIMVKLREADFSTRTRRTSLSAPADTAEQLFPMAMELISGMIRPEAPVRLIGIYAGNLEETAGGCQMSLYNPVEQKNRKLAAALDDIVERYGNRAVTRATLVPNKKS